MYLQVHSSQYAFYSPQTMYPLATAILLGCSSNKHSTRILFIPYSLLDGVVLWCWLVISLVMQMQQRWICCYTLEL